MLASKDAETSLENANAGLCDLRCRNQGCGPVPRVHDRGEAGTGCGWRALSRPRRSAQGLRRRLAASQDRASGVPVGRGSGKPSTTARPIGASKPSGTPAARLAWSASKALNSRPRSDQSSPIGRRWKIGIIPSAIPPCCGRGFLMTTDVFDPGPGPTRLARSSRFAREMSAKARSNFFRR
jgi:hypothetical protein